MGCGKQKFSSFFSLWFFLVPAFVFHLCFACRCWMFIFFLLFLASYSVVVSSSYQPPKRSLTFADVCLTYTFTEVSPNPKIAISSRGRKLNVKNITILGIILKLSMSYREFNVYILQQIKMLSLLRPWMKSLAEDPEAEQSSTAILSICGQQRGKIQILMCFFHSHLFFCCIKMIKFKY